MIKKRRRDVSTLLTTFYDRAVSRNLFSKAEMRQFGAAGTERLTIGNKRKIETALVSKRDLRQKLPFYL